MKTALKLVIVEVTKEISETKGQSAVFDYVSGYNESTAEPIPFENCKGCETSSPSLDHVFLVCGQQTTPKKAVFYQAVLKKVKGNVFDKVFPQSVGKNQSTLLERLGDEYGCCSECGHNEWMLLPNEGVAVKQGGKAYIECLTCGSTTHL
jgi:hypothetical protein